MRKLSIKEGIAVALAVFVVLVFFGIGLFFSQVSSVDNTDVVIESQEDSVSHEGDIDIEVVLPDEPVDDTAAVAD